MDELDRAVERSVLEHAIEGDTRISDVFVYYRNAMNGAEEGDAVERSGLLVRGMVLRGLITVFTSTSEKDTVIHTDLAGAALDAVLSDPKCWDPGRCIGPGTLWMIATKKGEMHPYSPDG